MIGREDWQYTTVGVEYWPWPSSRSLSYRSENKWAFKTNAKKIFAIAAAGSCITDSTASCATFISYSSCKFVSPIDLVCSFTGIGRHMIAASFAQFPTTWITTHILVLYGESLNTWCDTTPSHQQYWLPFHSSAVVASPHAVFARSSSVPFASSSPNAVEKDSSLAWSWMHSSAFNSCVLSITMGIYTTRIRNWRSTRSIARFVEKGCTRCTIIGKSGIIVRWALRVVAVDREEKWSIGTQTR